MQTADVVCSIRCYAKKGDNININRLDHLVLTVKDIEVTVQFYVSVLGMEKEEFGAGKFALKYGNQKINMHQAGKEFEPKT